MTSAQFRRGGCALVMAGLLAACASDQPLAPASTLAPTTSVAEADARLAGVAAERGAIERRYAEREAVCYEKFFVNNCLDDAKEIRRAALAVQRAIEVEAEHFKRKNTVDERDRAMAASEAAFQAEEARAAATPPRPPKTVTPTPPPRPSSVPGRIARQNARNAQEAAQEPARAAQRAANAAAYEERRRKSEARQREVAKRKAEREAKRAAEQARKDQEAKAAPAR